MPPIHTHDVKRLEEPEISTSPRKLSCDTTNHDNCHCQDPAPEPRPTTTITTPTQSSNRARKIQRVSITFGGPGSLSGSGSGSSGSASTPSSTSSPLFPLFEFYTQSPMCHTTSFPLPLKDEQHHPLALLSHTSPLESSTFGLKDCAALASLQTEEDEGRAQDILTSDTSTPDPHNSNPSRSTAPARDAHARFTFGYGNNSDALSLGTSLIFHSSQPSLNPLKANSYHSGRYNAELPPFPLSPPVHTPRIQSTTATHVPPSGDDNYQCDHGQSERHSPSSSSLTQGQGPCASAGEASTASNCRTATCARRSSLSLSLSSELDNTQPTPSTFPPREPRKKRFSFLGNIISMSKVSHTASSTVDKPLPPLPSSDSHSGFLSKKLRPRAISTSAASALELEHRSFVPGLESSISAASRRHNNYGHSNNNHNNTSYRNNGHLGAALQERRPSNASLQAIFNGIQVSPPHDLGHYLTSNVPQAGYSAADGPSLPSPVSTTGSTDGSPGRPNAFLGASRDSLVLNTFTFARSSSSPPPPSLPPSTPTPLRPPPPQRKGSSSCDTAEKSWRKRKKTTCGSWSLFCFFVK
ncbi:unnamed protein product [Mortierella alpina]